MTGDAQRAVRPTQLCALGRQKTGSSLAKPTARARDDDHLSIDVVIHESIISRSSILATRQARLKTFQHEHFPALTTVADNVAPLLVVIFRHQRITLAPSGNVACQPLHDSNESVCDFARMRT